MSSVNSEMASPNVKDQIRSVLDQLPNDCTFEDVQYELYVLNRIRRGLDAIARGDVVSHDEAKQRMQKWLTK